MDVERFCPPPPPTPADPTIPSTIKTLSEPSEEVFRLLADPDVPLPALCTFVNSDVDSIINEALILESRIYIRRKIPIAPHRRIVLKVQERRGKTFWLLLERRPTSRIALVKGLGTTVRNDEGQLSLEEDLSHLIDTKQYRLENKQIFNETVTLDRLRLIAQAMGEILTHYKLFSVNCWSFCAILQHELGWESRPFFQYGKMLEHKMYAAAQREVHIRVQKLNCMIDPMMLSTLLTTLSGHIQLSKEHKKLANDLKGGVDQLLRAEDLYSSSPSPARINAIQRLINELDKIPYLQPPTRKLGYAIWSQMIVLCRHLAKFAPGIYNTLLAEALRLFSKNLYFGYQRLDAISVGEEALGIKRHLHHNNPRLHSRDFLDYMTYLAEIYGDTQQPQKSLEALREKINVTKTVYGDIPRFIVQDVVQNLCRLGASLRPHSHSGALAQYQEALSLARQYPDVPSNDAPLLPSTLRTLGDFLREISDHEGACLVYREILDLWHNSQPTTTIKKEWVSTILQTSYHQSLLSLNRDEEAESVVIEAVGLRQQIYRGVEGPGWEEEKAGVELAEALEIFASFLMRQCRFEEASAQDNERISILCHLDEAYPNSSNHYDLKLAASLIDHALTLHGLGRSQEGCETVAKAVQMLTESKEGYHRWHILPRALDVKASLLHHLRQSLAVAEVYRDACVAYRQCVEVTRSVYESWHQTHYREILAKSLFRYSESLRRCNRIEQAQEAKGESIALGYELTEGDRDLGREVDEYLETKREIKV